MSSLEAVHSLQFENGQLRTELKAQQAVNMKLRKEKDDILLALHECKEENRVTPITLVDLRSAQLRALYEELKLRDQMFQEFREQKERELTELMAIKSDLEVRLHRVSEEDRETSGYLMGGGGGGGHDSPSESRFVGSGLPQLNAQEVVEALGKWEGMEDTVSLFNDLIRDKSAMEWVPGSPWSSKWQFSISLYISCTPDCEDLVSTIMRDYVPRWQKQCMDGGCSLMPCHFQPSALAQFPLNDDYMRSVCSSEVDRSDIFVCLLRDTSSNFIKLEVEYGHLNNPLARPSVFLLLPSSQSSERGGESGVVERLKVRVKRAGDHAKILQCTDDVSDSLSWVSEQIETILRKEFSVSESVEGDSDEVMVRIGQLEDMRAEWQQQKTLEHYVHRAPPKLFGIDTVYDRLEEYMSEGGPVLPLLLTGHPGLGKSTLLAKWIDGLERSGSKSDLVLYHFVTCLGSSSSEPGVIFRRLLKKIKYVCGEATSLPTIPSSLMEAFTDSLEKLSVAKVEEGGMAVIVIDGADLIKDCEQSLYWLLQPLPNNIRVVLSANDENYPDSWRALPSPSIPTPTAQEMQDIVEFVAADSDTLTLEQVGNLAVEGPSIPLWGVLATQHALSVQAETPEVMDEIINSLITEQEVGELTCLILKALEESCPWIASSIEQVLKVVYWSRNGLLFGELFEITGLPETLLRLTVCELQRRSILHCCAGLLQLSHSDMQDAIQLKFSSLSSSESMLQWTEQLTTYYLKSPNLMCRTAEEVPWLLQRADLKKELYHIVLSVDILVQLYSGGHGEELLGYWEQLDQSLNVMATQYHTRLRAIEETQEGNASVSPEGMCSMFRTVGKVISSLGFSQEALSLFQHYLQLCEAHCEPDGVEVAEAFTEIAQAYTHVGRLGAAEEYYYQALAIYEASPDVSSSQVLKVVEALIGVLEKLKRVDIAQALSTKAFAMKNMTKMTNTPSKILKARAAQLEQCCFSQQQEYSDMTIADMLNEYAVLLYLFGDASLAEELFLRSWKVYESQCGESDMMVLIPLQNLALFYAQTDSVEKATSLYEKVFEIQKEMEVSSTEVIGKLATLYRQQSRLDLAEPFQIQFADLKERALGPHHLDVARALNNLAVMYSMQDKYAKALPTYDRALKAYRYNFPEDHPTVSTVVQNRQLAAHMLEQLTYKLEPNILHP